MSDQERYEELKAKQRYFELKSKTATPPPAQEEQSFGRTLLEEAPEIVGSTIGEVAGAIGGAAVGHPIAGATLGAGVGQATGEAAKQLYQHATGSEVAPRTSGEAAKRMGIEFAQGAAGSVIGAGIGKVASKVAAPFKESVRSGVKAVRESLKRFGSELTPAQATDSAILDIVEDTVAGSFTGRGTLKAFKEGQEGALKKLTNEVVESIAGNASEKMGDEGIGQLFLQTAKKGREVHRAVANEMYAHVDDLTAGTGASVLDIKKAARALEDQYGRLKLRAPSELTDVLKAVREYPDDMPFAVVNELRSELLNRTRDLQETVGKGKVAKELGELVTATTGSIENAAKNLSGEALDAWKGANAFYKTGKETFENDFMAKLLIKNKVQPAKIGEVVFRSGNVDEIRKVQKALQYANELDPSIDYDGTWRAMKSGYLQSVFEKNTVNGAISGKGILEDFSERKIGRTLSEVFTQKEVSRIRNLATVMERAQSKVDGGASVAIKLAQAGATFQLIASPFQDEGSTANKAAKAGATGILIAPYVLGRLMTNPTGIKLLTEGFEMGMKGKAITQHLPSLMSKLTFEIFSEQDKSDKLNRDK